MDAAESPWTSRSKVERLGRQLLSEFPPSSERVDELHQLLGAYDDALTTAVQRIESVLGVATTSRLKNTGTILEKLRRHGGSFLSKIQDLAGVRIVEDIGIADQNVLMNRVVELFKDGSKLPKVIDRRVDPRQGYRAVHIVIRVDNLPVEVQIRTKLQHDWANMFEKLADIIGREIRYGGKPADRSNGIEPLSWKIIRDLPRPLTESWASTADWFEKRMWARERLVEVMLEHSRVIEAIETATAAFGNAPTGDPNAIIADGVAAKDFGDYLLMARSMNAELYRNLGNLIESFTASEKVASEMFDRILRMVIDDFRDPLADALEEVLKSENVLLEENAKSKILEKVDEIVITSIRKTLADDGDER